MLIDDPCLRRSGPLDVPTHVSFPSLAFKVFVCLPDLRLASSGRMEQEPPDKNHDEGAPEEIHIIPGIRGRQGGDHLPEPREDARVQ